LKEKVKALGMDLGDWDGCSEIYVKRWEDWENFYKVIVSLEMGSSIPW
jgi:hypothetical protein